MARPFNAAEAAHDKAIQSLRRSHYAEARDDMARAGMEPMPSSADPSEWMDEVVLTSFGYFMIRLDLFLLARRFKSRTLFTEALATNEHWDKDQAIAAPLESVAAEYASLAVGHEGPRHDPPSTPPWDLERGVDMRKEAA